MNGFIFVDGYCWVVKYSITREGVRLRDSTVAEVSGADLLGTMVLDLKNINKGTQYLNPNDTLFGEMSESLSDVVQGQIAPLKAKTDESALSQKPNFRSRSQFSGWRPTKFHCFNSNNIR